MKKLVIAAVALMVSLSATYAQGQFNFGNRVQASGVNAKIFGPDGTTAATTPPYSAGLAIDNGGALTYVPGTATAFRTGAAAGFTQPFVVTLQGHDVGTQVTVRMIGFGGSTDADATAQLASKTIFGQSAPLTITLGGGTVLPPDMVGLQGFTITPEPSTIAFGLLGAAALLIRRRK